MKLNRTLVMAVSIVLAAALSIGGTLAYMTDRESAVNVFTVGNVDIQLNEDFEKEEANLVPGADINKDVTIENIGDNDAWVWYTYSIPAAMDRPTDASGNMLHVNHAGRNWLGYQNNQKYWEEGQTEATPEDQCWIVDYTANGNGNPVGQEIIDGVVYNIYAVLYNGVLPVGEETTIGMTNVYLDTHVDYNPNDGYFYWVNKGNAVQIQNPDGTPFDITGTKLYVNAYAIQEDGFTTVQDAYKAYGEQWGTNFNAAVNNLTASDAQEKLEKGGAVNVAEDIELTEASTELKNPTTITLNGTLSSSRNDKTNDGAAGISTLTVYNDTTISGNGTVENIEAYAITVRGGSLTINGGSYKAVTTAVNMVEGALYITGGTFEAAPYNGDCRYLINCADQNYRDGKITVEITGGSFKEWDPSNSKGENPAADFVPEGYKVVTETKDGATWYTVVAE